MIDMMVVELAFICRKGKRKSDWHVITIFKH